MPKQRDNNNESHKAPNPVLWAKLPEEELKKKINSILPPELVREILKAKTEMDKQHKGPKSSSGYQKLTEIDQMMTAYKLSYDIIHNTRMQGMRMPPNEQQKWEHVAIERSVNAILTNPNFSALVAINGPDGIGRLAVTMLEVLKGHGFNILPIIAIQEATATAFGFGSKTKPKDMRPRSKF